MTPGFEDGYFIPESIVVGYFRADRIISCAELQRRLCVKPAFSDFGFPTCRFKYEQWVSQGIFERLTGGYRPSNQRDRAAQLKKTVTGAVGEMKNDPVSGFRVIAGGVNSYGVCASDDDLGDVIIEDPRGFCISVWRDSFFQTFAMSGLNVIDGKLAGKYVYGWSMSGKYVTLIPEIYPEYGKWKAVSDSFKTKRKSVRSVSRRDLVRGHVYRAAKVLTGDWMYAGVFDTYSQNCHVDAFDAGGRYDTDKFIKREFGLLRQKYLVKWPTTSGKLIFYSMTPQPQQYVIRSDIDGVFSHEVQPSDDGLYRNERGDVYMMYDGQNPVTAERVLDDICGSPAFNRISFTPNPVYRQTPAGSFERDFGQTRFSPAFFPFAARFSASIVRSENGYWQKIASYGPYDKPREFKIYPDIGRICAAYLQPVSKFYTVKAIGAEELRKIAKPLYPEYRLENGRLLKPEHAAVFVPKEIREAAQNIY